MTVTSHESIIEADPSNAGVEAATTALSSTVPSGDVHKKGIVNQPTFQQRNAARQLRKSLKESGDYLGVQGINPTTGQMDVLTPTNSSDSTKHPAIGARLDALAQVVQASKEAYEEAMENHETELQRESTRRELRKMEKLDKGKQVMRDEQRKVRWRKEAAGWSSVAEPNLSPIAQSQRSSNSCKFEQERP